MISRRKLLQLAALQGLGALSFSAHAVKTYNWSPGLVSLETIAHSFFGDLPLTLSKKTQISFDYPEAITNGKAIHITTGILQTKVTIKNIHSPKLILAMQGYNDLVSHTVAVYNFSELFGDKIQTRINLNAFDSEHSPIYRVWALTEGDNKILCSYDDIYYLVSGY